MVQGRAGERTSKESKMKRRNRNLQQVRSEARGLSYGSEYAVSVLRSLFQSADKPHQPNLVLLAM